MQELSFAPKQGAAGHSRCRVAKRLLLFWCVFIGLGAVAGAACMLLAPDGHLMGMQGLLPYFQVLPLAGLLYQDFRFPGIALLCVNGLPNLIAALLLVRGKKAGIVCGGVFGLTLMAWIGIQFVIFPCNLMSNLYFVFGVLQAATGFAAWVFARQEAFVVRQADYPHIGTAPDRLVVYFSRMGYTKKAALEAAEQSGAQVYAVQPAERTQGTLGFWWCGRFGLHGWPMPIADIPLELSAYRQVTICTPVWVFRLAAPMRSFCQAARGKLCQTDYILTHFNPFGYGQVAEEMDELLGTPAARVESLCVQWGKVRSRQVLRGAHSAKTG